LAIAISSFSLLLYVANSFIIQAFKNNAKYVRLVDVNGDGQVDIFDLTTVAGNYGKAGPMTNWQ